MKTKHRKTKPKPVRQSVLLGVFWDVVAIVKIAFAVLSWPFKLAGNELHKLIKHHPQFKSDTVRLCISAVIGLFVLAVVFAVQNLSHHYLFQFGVETAKAAGVCPIWETIAMIIRPRA